MKRRRNPGTIPHFCLTAALGISESSMRTGILTGSIPAPDLQRGRKGDRVWSFDTLHAWRPEIADKAMRIRAIYAEVAV